MAIEIDNNQAATKPPVGVAPSVNTLISSEGFDRDKCRESLATEPEKQILALRNLANNPDSRITLKGIGTVQASYIDRDPNRIALTVTTDSVRTTSVRTTYEITVSDDGKSFTVDSASASSYRDGTPASGLNPGSIGVRLFADKNQAIPVIEALAGASDQ